MIEEGKGMVPTPPSEADVWIPVSGSQSMSYRHEGGRMNALPQAERCREIS